MSFNTVELQDNWINDIYSGGDTLSYTDVRYISGSQ
jgi:hypothetical protein